MQGCVSRSKQWKAIWPSGMACVASFMLIASPGLVWSAENIETTLAKKLFGHLLVPDNLQPSAIGSYARGCMAGAEQMPADGPAWQAMRLERGRNWGQPVLVNYLKKLAQTAKNAGEWPGLLIGDMAQPRGGPMLTGHASHQIGLDADIWLSPMPAHRMTFKERSETSAISMLQNGTRVADLKKLSFRHMQLIARAANYPEVARIFVHPGIKKAICDVSKGQSRPWMRKIRPWYGHHYHFHVRLACPPGSTNCKNQNAPPAGDGCGKELSWWLSEEPWKPKKPSGKPKKKRKPVVLSSLPQQCRQVLKADDSAIYGTPLITIMPSPRPVL
ncbi:MAG: penicillin-insensitive murein endopeptidase [Cohaesibacteraceae bacterium]|nr:penicillin-insensitive murein endopeptidase [Cohaesibacteraceae bacterium]